MTTFDEKECMACNPFEGDFGDGEIVLTDKIVTARKGGTCHLCRQEIKPGERIRTRKEAYDGKIDNFRWCSECCSAMAASWTDDGKAWEARAALNPDAPRPLTDDEIRPQLSMLYDRWGDVFHYFCA